ncbi:MAG: hypothetical protein H8D45_09620 [Bacteroidetes bacterium]|nr:hypothetical protein [Bacteroidota bacterium]
MIKPASDKYNLTIPPGVYHIHGFGEVDLRSLTLERAEQLVLKGFPYLVIKPKSKTPAPAPEIKKIKRNKNHDRN